MLSVIKLSVVVLIVWDFWIAGVQSKLAKLYCGEIS
jgi:hypothetical protein